MERRLAQASHKFNKDSTTVNSNPFQARAPPPPSRGVKNKTSLVAVLCLIQFLSNSSFSQMAPFYPLKAREKGVSVIWIGMVIGLMAFMQIVSSALVGKFLHQMGGRNFIIIVGSLLIIFQTTFLTYLNYENDVQRFLAFSFLAQAMGGLGAGANSTASMAILSSFDAEDREKYIGYVEMANGVGLLFGPLLGAMLYSIGGYMMPFATFAIFYLLCYPFIVITLLSNSRLDHDSQVEEEDMAQAELNREEPKEEIHLSLLLMKPRFVYGLLSQMMLMMSIQYLAPNLAIHLHDQGYNAS
mmetsp:Transcript_16613/g.28301  ORF Transcript_16613/g.28301 Transcript_16613/m.28301 type:complete len:299 (-) Transcript_16613:695-1591(-)